MSETNGDRNGGPGSWLDRRGGYAAGPKTAAELKKPPRSVIAPIPNGHVPAGAHRPQP